MFVGCFYLSDFLSCAVRNALPTERHRWPPEVISSIVKNEGFAGLYKGFVPKILRLGPGGGLMIVVFEFVASLIK